MSIRVNEIPEANSNYDLTNKKILIHDLTAVPTGSTKLIDLARVFSTNTNISNGDKGDILVSSLGSSWVIKNNIISLEKLSKLAGNKLLGNPNNSVENVSGIDLGPSLSFVDSTLNVISNTSVQKVNIQSNGNFIGSNSIINFIQGSNITLSVLNDLVNNKINIKFDGILASTISNGDYGDLTVVSSTVWALKTNVITTEKILNNAVTYSKIQKLNGVSLLGNYQVFTNDVSEIQLQPSLRFNGTFLEVTPDTSIQKVSILSGGALISSRKAINFNFTNLGYSITDDNLNNRVNINLNGLPGATSFYKNGVFVGSQSTLNFIDGSNTLITAINNTVDQRLDITVTSLNQTLQLVTNTNNRTTNNILVVKADGFFNVSSSVQFGDATLGQIDNSIGGYLRLANNQGMAAQIQVSNLTAQRVLELPNGNGVIPLRVNGVGANSSGNIVITNYKVYTALLTQTGTDAPIATVLENTIGNTITWTRESAGIYNAVGFGSVNKVCPPFDKNSFIAFRLTSSLFYTVFANENVTYAQVIVGSNQDLSANVDLNNSSIKLFIEIRVYN